MSITELQQTCLNNEEKIDKYCEDMSYVCFGSNRNNSNFNAQANCFYQLYILMYCIYIDHI